MSWIYSSHAWDHKWQTIKIWKYQSLERRGCSSSIGRGFCRQRVSSTNACKSFSTSTNVVRTPLSKNKWTDTGSFRISSSVLAYRVIAKCFGQPEESSSLSIILKEWKPQSLAKCPLLVPFDLLTLSISTKEVKTQTHWEVIVRKRWKVSRILRGMRSPI